MTTHTIGTRYTHPLWPEGLTLTEVRADGSLRLETPAGQEVVSNQDARLVAVPVEPTPRPTPSFWAAAEGPTATIAPITLAIPDRDPTGHRHHTLDSFGVDALLPNPTAAFLATGSNVWATVRAEWEMAIVEEGHRDVTVRQFRSPTATATKGFHLRPTDGAFLRRTDARGEAVAIHRHAWRQMIALLTEAPPANLANWLGWLWPEARAQAFSHVMARSERPEGEGNEILLRTHRDPVTGLRALRAVLSGSHSSLGFDDQALITAIAALAKADAPAFVRRSLLETTGWAAMDVAGTTPGVRATIHWSNSEVGAKSLEWWAGCYITALDSTVRFRGQVAVTQETKVTVASAASRTRRIHRLPTKNMSHGERMKEAASRLAKDVKKVTAAASTLATSWAAALENHPGGVKLVAGESMVADVLMDALAERSRWPVNAETEKTLREIFTTDTRLAALPFGSAAYIAGAFAVAASKSTEPEEAIRLQEMAGDWVLHGWRN